MIGERRKGRSSRRGIAIVCVVGDAGIEYRLKAERLPVPDFPVQARGFYELVAGRGGLQAIASSRLGADAVLLCKLGDDSQAELLRSRFGAERVRLGPIPRDTGARTGVSLVAQDSAGTALTSHYPGANKNLGSTDVFEAAPDLAESGAVVVSLGISRESASAAIRLAAGSQRPVIVDSAGSGDPGSVLDSDLLPLVDLLRLRASDAEQWTGSAANDRDSARIAAERLTWRGARAVIVDAGEEEKLLLQEERELHLPRYSVTGNLDSSSGPAEDVFVAGLAVALAEGRSLFESATFANAAGALAVRNPSEDRNLPFRHAVIDLLRRDGIDFSDTSAAA